jgi:hypothetical protein
LDNAKLNYIVKCVPKEKKYPVYDRFPFVSIYENKKINSYSNNIQNMIRSLQLRVLKRVPLTNPASDIFKVVKRILKLAARRIVSQRKLKILSQTEIYDYIISHYSGPPRKRYLKALESLKAKQLCKDDSIIKAFIKDELVLMKEDPDLEKPRMIGPRGDRWMVAMGIPFKNFEKAIYNTTNVFNKLDNNRESGKGLNIQQKENLVNFKIAELYNPANILLDGTAWDAHIDSHALHLEYYFYLQLLKMSNVEVSYIKFFTKWFELQKFNIIKFKHESGHLKAFREAGRMSGDWNTSGGNGVLMTAMVTGIMEYMKVKPTQYRQLNEGDDHLLLVSANVDDNFLNKISALFLDLGQEIKCVYNKDLLNVKFCQQLLIHDGNRYRFMKDYPRFIYKFNKFISLNIK